MTTKTLQKLREAASGYDSIDEESGVIRGVRVLGLKSKNNRRYLAEAANRATGKYNESRVFVDHNRKEGERSLSDWWGVLREARTDSDGVRADLHYNKNHPMTPQLIEAAKRFPTRFGLSHVASGATERSGGETVVTDIDEVISVDVVSNPATTKGLFESDRAIQTTFGKLLEQHESQVAFARQLREDMGGGMYGELPTMQAPVAVDADDSPEAQVSSAFRTLLVSVIDDEALDTPGKLAKLKAIMTVKDKAQDAIGKPADANAQPEGAKPAAATTAQESDAVAALKAENANLREQVETFKTTEACKALLTESKREITPVRVKALLAIPEADRKALVESWPQFVEPSDDDEGKPAARRPERPAYSPSIIKESAGDAMSYPSDTKSFREQLRG